MSSNLKGALIALLAFGVFASHDVIVKVLGGNYSPVQLVFFSVLLSFPLATITLMGDPKPSTLRPVHPYWVGARTVTAVITGLCAFYAFSVLPLAQVYAIIFASPLIITILSIPILGEVVRVRRWMAVIVGLCGVLVVLRPGSTELTLGHLAALVAAISNATTSIIVRRIGSEERPVVLMLYPMVANFLVMGSALYWVYVPMPVEHLGLVAVLSVLGWTGGRLVVSAYSTGEAAIVAPMQYSQILWASAYGLLFFNEVIDRPTAIGAGIIIASGVYIVLRESRGGASANRPVLRTRSRHDTATSFRISTFLRLRGRHPEDK
ncbi:Putative transporter, RhaT family, DMT superfamily protein [Oceanicola granulosus HTCC2516]|uniref:Putative transporter, RhaT family, DMT superfamily protein n=1 Tax=Oceanicola granulosus (strain ATCC BAA-861 / DSM 15982 / KCTC 12143 / HTCC2516) TaxID=314256 RepID=Q2CJH9_OCEGH|nr:DMT family transporter [Oceanicola granulosus]EAR53160.1 Putative transporter, RhaT family, DMT superfamily protein [Oceanicola granulosus HTCC2516]